jgi:2-oxoisovalerate dehydrogenase E2 component (dihydrolipoyl transacylase)
MKTFNLPDLGEGLAEAEIVRWHVNPGDHVKIDDPMLAVETAKAIVEVPSPFSGVIKATHGKPGDMVATGALLVEFEAGPSTDSGTVVGRMPTSDEDFVAEHSSSSDGSAAINNAAPQSGRVRAVPAARALAQRLGIDLTQIRGTGRGELVTVDDVLHASHGTRSLGPTGAATGTPSALASTALAAAAPAAIATAGARVAGTPASPQHVLAGGTTTRTPSAPTSATSASPQHSLADASTTHSPHEPAITAPGDAEPLRGPRRAMAQSMALARDNVMGCTLFDDADLHEWRDDQDITSRLLRAVAAGCAAEPGLNAWFDGTAQTRRTLQHIDVAIAVDTPDGLIAPVIRNIAGRPVAELRRDVDKLKRNTRSRAVAPEDLRNFTFMLSNFGMIAGRYATPVVVPPAVAILGSGRLSHDVVATKAGAIEAHLRMPLSLTFDHRCITGGEAARFLAAVIRDLQKGS